MSLDAKPVVVVAAGDATALILDHLARTDTPVLVVGRAPSAVEADHYRFEFLDVDPASLEITDGRLRLGRGKKVAYRHLVVAGSCPIPTLVGVHAAHGETLAVYGGGYGSIMAALEAVTIGLKPVLVPGPAGLLPKEFRHGFLDHTARFMLEAALEAAGVEVSSSAPRKAEYRVARLGGELPPNLSGRRHRHSITVYDFRNYESSHLSVDQATFNWAGFELVASILFKRPMKVPAYHRLRIAHEHLDLLIAVRAGDRSFSRRSKAFRVTDMAEPMHHSFRFRDGYLDTVLQIGRRIDHEPVLFAMDAGGFCPEPGSLIRALDDPPRDLTLITVGLRSVSSTSTSSRLVSGQKGCTR